MECLYSRQFTASQWTRKIQPDLISFDQEGELICNYGGLIITVIAYWYHYRDYDIRIADNCGPLVPVKRDSITYGLAEELTRCMKRKKYDCTFYNNFI